MANAMPTLIENGKERKKERKKDILTSLKRPKWPIRPNKRLQIKKISK